MNEKIREGKGATMTVHPKPVVVVSRCLEFEACRYNGQVIPDPLVRRLREFVVFRTVCPEADTGMGIPRPPIRIVNEGGRNILYQPSTGREFTREMEEFTKAFLETAGDADGFLLKFGSPSCGPSNVKIYMGREKAVRAVKGSGFFGGAVTARFPGAPAEDEGRLKNFLIREHFLTRLFTAARYRETKKRGTVKALVDFHTAHKLLLMGYSQSRMRLMGKIAAALGTREPSFLLEEYGAHLDAAMEKMPGFAPMINVLMHAFGGFKKVLSGNEKKFFLDSLEEYRDERIPLSTLLHLLRAWAVRFENRYLMDQVFMEPYPRKLVEISDSGKGRDL